MIAVHEGYIENIVTNQKTAFLCARPIIIQPHINTVQSKIVFLGKYTPEICAFAVCFLALRQTRLEGVGSLKRWSLTGDWENSPIDWISWHFKGLCYLFPPCNFNWGTILNHKLLPPICIWFIIFSIFPPFRALAKVSHIIIVISPQCINLYK